MIKTIVLDKADRLYHFPFDLEDYFPRRIVKGSNKKNRVIDLGHFKWPVENPNLDNFGDPIRKATSDSIAKLKTVLVDWLEKEYSLRIDPRKEIYIGQGIRRIVFDFCQAFIEYGDIALCPEPGIPFYKRHVISSGGIPVTYPISERTDLRPSFKRLSTKLGKSARIMILNNPHNPLGTILDNADLDELVQTTSRENIFIISDAAYSSLTSDEYSPLMKIRGARKVGLELFSAPYSLGLPYFPLGFAVGSAQVINGLKIIGRSTGIYIPQIWIDMTLQALSEYPSVELKQIRKNIGLARTEARRFAEKVKWDIIGSNSAPFLWTRIPGRKQSAALAATMLRKRKILILPGNAFGETCEGYIRLSLTAGHEEYSKAIGRLSKQPIPEDKAME